MTQERRDELHVEELPRNLGDATAELEKDQFLIDVLGENWLRRSSRPTRKNIRSTVCR